jgi:hypothetical protein
VHLVPFAASYGSENPVFLLGVLHFSIFVAGLVLSTKSDLHMPIGCTASVLSQLKHLFVQPWFPLQICFSFSLAVKFSSREFLSPLLTSFSKVKFFLGPIFPGRTFRSRFLVSGAASGRPMVWCIPCAPGA